MTRHGLHIISLIKGATLFSAVVLFAVTGSSSDLSAGLAAFTNGWPAAVYPFYWFTIVFAVLVLVFPFTLAQDHMMRMAEGQEDEAPMTYWLNGLMVELLVGTLVGCLLSAAMKFSPEGWWLLMSFVWVAYEMAAPAIQFKFMSKDIHEGESLGDLETLLREPLQRIGMDLKEIRLLDDDPTLQAEADVVIHRRDKKYTLYVPADWATTWKSEELTAVVLQKAWMTRPAIRRKEFFLHVFDALVCFGGFAALFAFVGKYRELPPIHSLETAPWLVGWLLIAMSGFRILAFACYRHWFYRSDAAVAAQMKSSAPLVHALERAARNTPAFLDYPRWAEILLFHAPSLTRRIERLKTE